MQLEGISAPADPSAALKASRGEVLDSNAQATFGPRGPIEAKEADSSSAQFMRTEPTGEFRGRNPRNLRYRQNPYASPARLCPSLVRLKMVCMGKRLYCHQIHRSGICELRRRHKLARLKRKDLSRFSRFVNLVDTFTAFCRHSLRPPPLRHRLLH
jgi:hypothetical protein